jgi:ribonucleoside-diphosphate reductase alpha chain
MSEVVQKAQYLMDDMIDLEIEQIEKILEKIESDPEPASVKQIEKDMWINIKNQATLGRRTGLGVTAVGDSLAALGIRYGSKKSISVVELFYKCLSTSSYRASCEMARDRGAFPIHDHNKEIGNQFLERIWEEDPEILDMSKKHGRRNIALTTTAPAGSVSTLTQTTSGIEPAFMLYYTRRKKLTDQDTDGRIDFVDDNGDKWQEYTIYHHGFKHWMSHMVENKPGIFDGLTSDEMIAMSPYAGSTANEIDWIAKVKMQAAAQKWVCHAISNTTNLPKDADIETVKKVYMMGWKLGCKGITVYREGSRSGVLVKKEDAVNRGKKNQEIRTSSAPKRPDELHCEIYQASISGEPWTIVIGLMHGLPYEIFGGKSEYVEIPRKYTSGILLKRPRKTMDSKYDLRFGSDDDELTIRDIVKIFDNPNHSAFTRTLSLALRHGAPVHYICEQLQKDKDADLFSFSKVIARCLKKYIVDGTKPGNGIIKCNCESYEQTNIVYQEGCVTCLSCGYAKCG